jgi:hypothetical protein
MKKLLPVIVVIMIAALLLAACGGGAAPSGGVQSAATEPSSKPAENKPAAQATTPPVEQPTAVEPTAEPETLELSNVTAGLNELNSYKASFTMTFEGQEDGQPKTSTLAFTEEFVKEPPAKRTIITGFGSMLGGGTDNSNASEGGIELIEVGGKMYSKMGDICSQVTADSGPQATTMMDPNSIIGGVRGAQRVGNETVNGIPAVHYKLDVTGLETMGYLNGDGDVWVAESGKFVVKYAFQATGTDKLFGMGAGSKEGTIKWIYELTEVNQPIDIQAPADCGGAAEDIPMMADAQDQAAFGGASTYSTPSKFEDVVAFYEKEMPANGWTEAEGGMSADGLSMKNYTKDGRSVQVMISADSGGGKTTVMITEAKE